MNEQRAFTILKHLYDLVSIMNQYPIFGIDLDFICVSSRFLNRHHFSN